MRPKKYTGVFVPVVTPLTADHQLDENAVEKLLRNFQQENVVPFILGTTGEVASLPLSVKRNYIKKAVSLKRRDDLIFAGVSSNCLQESVELAKYCFDSGIDAVVATLPAYFSLTENEMLNYFETLTEKVAGPVIIYNIPATTHMSIPLKIIETLSYHQHIVGIKDSERSEDRLLESLQLWSQREDFSHLIGWAAKSAKALLNGSDGLVPSTANFCPGLYRQLYEAGRKGNQEITEALQRVSDDLGNIYQSGRTLGTSLWALKVILQEEGLCQPYVMPPLLDQDEKEAEIVKLQWKQIKEHLLINKEKVQIV
ncbi:dihydrodipicolinate synthase family protein [Chitinophagaceae bacterium LB-8]|uniref:Dihydrodipicolinate synthase family protein n=1 Tax=Paraflavisolibacter caeni TaxID=2982496 RepID=A0A9X2XZQ3_9BACT|nr:dihydrodipicolinate synthase family protein [Paraflavisolibacter caeni]MCU7551892.1 dihydrodipicolinate synthase family protein [Paraflavisolibacter caeni]